MKPVFVVLEIQTWVGMDSSACHYYGKLIYNQDSLEVKRILTKKQVDELNRKDKRCTYSEGDLSCRFLSLESLTKEAIRIFKEEFPKGSILVKGSYAVAQAQERYMVQNHL